MAKTVMQMVSEAQAAVPGTGPEEARRRIQEDPSTLIVDVRDAANRQASGMVEGQSRSRREPSPSLPTPTSPKGGVIPACRTAPVP